MHFKFEQHLEHINELAREEVAEVAEQPNQDHEAEVRNVAHRAAKKAHTSVEAEYRIYDLQVEKQQAMQGLREKLRQLDAAVKDTKPITEGSPLRATENGLMTETETGPIYLTKGDVAVAPMWGTKLGITPEIPRDVAKEYLISETREELRARLDEQIAVRETMRTSNAHVQEAFIKGLEQRLHTEELGNAAEKMMSH
jgi:hypothetical protein